MTQPHLTTRARAFVSRLFAYLRVTPVIEALSPEIDPVDDLKELRRRHGLSQIMRDNVIEFERRRQLQSCCESSPFRKPQ